jgi:TraM recognition site of TraD and TraG
MTSTWDQRRFLARPNTLVMVTPEHVQEDVTPLAVCLVEDLREAALGRADASPSAELDVPLLLALDECKPTAPVRALTTLLTTGRSRRIYAIAAFQTYGQVVELWGTEAEGLVFSSTASIIFFADSGEQMVTARLSQLSGRIGRPQVTHTTARSAEWPLARFPRLGGAPRRTEHHGFVEMPVCTEAAISNIPDHRAGCACPRRPSAWSMCTTSRSSTPSPRGAACARSSTPYRRRRRPSRRTSRSLPGRPRRPPGGGTCAAGGSGSACQGRQLLRTHWRHAHSRFAEPDWRQVDTFARRGGACPSRSRHACSTCAASPRWRRRRTVLTVAMAPRARVSSRGRRPRFAASPVRGGPVDSTPVHGERGRHRPSVRQGHALRVALRPPLTAGTPPALASPHRSRRRFHHQEATTMNKSSSSAT